MRILKTLAFFKVDDLLVLCVGNTDNSDEDIDAWLERLRLYDWKQVLISARGSAAMSSTQRSRILEFNKDYQKKHGGPMRIVLVSDQLFPRILGNMLSTITGNSLKAFAGKDLSKALDHLECTVDLTALEKELDTVHSRMD